MQSRVLLGKRVTAHSPDVIRYVENQASHHATRNFEEFLELLKKYSVKYDPAHVLG